MTVTSMWSAVTSRIACGSSATTPTFVRRATTSTTARAGARRRSSRLSRDRPRLDPEDPPVGANAAHHVSGPGRPRPSRLSDAAARSGAARSPARLESTRRAVAARRLGLRPRGPVARQSGLCRAAGELPRLPRVWHRPSGCRRPRVGAAMQADLLDAKRWAVERGYLRPDKICLMGGSYGGYATMAALALDPKEFACGISLAGVTDLALNIDANGSGWLFKGSWGKRVGNVDTEVPFLRSRSPLFMVNTIESRAAPGARGERSNRGAHPERPHGRRPPRAPEAGGVSPSAR